MSLPVPRSGDFILTYIPDNPKAAFSATKQIHLADDVDHQEIELRLPTARSIKGKVINDRSGEPVAGVRLTIRPAIQNPDLDVQSLPISQEDGSFEGNALPGQTWIEVRSSVFGFLSSPVRGENGNVISVKLPEDAESANVVVKLSSGLVISGTVIDADGSLCRNAKIQISQSGQRHDQEPTVVRTDYQGRFEISGLDPNSPTTLFASTGKASDLQEFDPQPLEKGDSFRQEKVQFALKQRVQLTGRIIKKGRPVQGVKVQLHQTYRVDDGIPPLICPPIMTGDDGRYILGGLDPGDAYTIQITANDGSIAAGWQHQNHSTPEVLGDIEGTVELSDAILKRTSQSLNGVVVSPDGEPVAGVSVSAQLPGGGSIESRDDGTPPWTRTNRRGEFKLSQLPDEQIELLVYKADPAEGGIRYPARISPKRNQSGIKIIFDQALRESLEDLDVATE